MSLLLTLAGLARTGRIERSRVDPGFPAYISESFTSRGLPFEWLVTDREGDAAALPWGQRFLAGSFLLSWMFNLVPVALIWGAFAWIRRRS